MFDIYDFNNKIDIVTTPSGDKVITMNDEIWTLICNHIFDASEFQKQKGLQATGDNTFELWQAIVNK